MLNKLKLTILSLIFSCHISYTQTGECGTSGIDPEILMTLPHYGNGAFLDEVISLTQNADKSSLKFSSGYANNGTLFNIPVKIWIFHDDSGANAALTDNEAIELIERVNLFHEDNNTNIRFYLKCAISHINSSKNNLITGKEDFDDTLDLRDETNAMDWFFVDDIDWINDDGNRVGGAAYYPWHDRKFKYAIETGGRITDWLVASTVHEVGHNLGLPHTFDGNKGGQFYNGDVTSDTKQELVSRSAEIVVSKYFLGIKTGEDKYTVCEVNGDAICDTQANPRALGSTNLSGCTYIGERNPATGTNEKEQDLLGWTFRPQEQNFMAYTPTNCRIEFTQGQIAVMHSNIMEYMSYTNFTTFPILVNNEYWYNRNNIVLSSNVNSGEVDNIYASENIISNPDSSISVLNNGTANLIAQNSIILKPGFFAQNGANFSAKIQSIQNCNLVGQELTRNSSTISAKGISYDDISMKTFNDYHALLKENKKEIDYDITIIEELVTVKNNTVKSFAVYPNPTSDYIIIEYDSSNTTKAIISDQNGSLIKSYNTNNDLLRINVSDLNSGLYLISIYLKDGTTKNFKVIKK